MNEPASALVALTAGVFSFLSPCVLPLVPSYLSFVTGMSLEELGIDREPVPAHISVKESVFPFQKFVGVDIVLGPEMRSTGEVMGVSHRFPIAFAKSCVTSQSA